SLIEKVEVKSIAHITGGGFYGNIPRVIPKNCKVVIKKGSWCLPEIYKIAMKKIALPEKELYTTFNMGIGMVLVVSPKDVTKVIKEMTNRHGVKCWEIGVVARGGQCVEMV
ncbi:MAG: phosphoribosylformylglycinamidine cyclo-ligase, partial [Candidatus Omnitrophica bacterium]|nr:phosphoribosylformylglycinamidine cyclo-ligase [Candidatus Omnitrophota bacterium]